MPENELLFNVIYAYICPLAMLIMGIKYKVKPPVYPKGNTAATSGYRSAMAKCNEDTWKTAHSCIGILWAVLGAVMLLVTWLCMDFMMAQENFELAVVIFVFLQLFVFIAPPVLITEIRLRMLFDKDGKRKTKVQ